MPHAAVLTNDLQYDLVNKDANRRAVVDDVLKHLVRFLHTLRANHTDVIHLQMINREDDPRAERYNGWLPATADSPGKAVLAEIVEPSDLIVEKHSPSGFFGTNLDDILSERGVTDLIVVGMHTQICIQATAADGYFRGYNVAVPREGVVSTIPEDAQRALEWIGKYCGAVLTMDEIVERIKNGTLAECMPQAVS
jgi:nicotinamidase-related amidase